MAVCNLFKKLDKNTGNFLMFSQYVEDITKSYTQLNQYRVSPSKFIALNIDYAEFDNESFPTLLQNHFENGCAFLREEVDWKPEYSKNLFWNALSEVGLIKPPSDNICEVVYIGNIDLESYNVHEGMGYSEIYCYIPNDAKKIYMNKLKYTSKLQKKYENDCISGWSINEYKEGVTLSFGEEDSLYPVKNHDYHYGNILRCYDYDGGSKNETVEDFSFNTIVVLYDIIYSDGNRITDIPLGIYLTGLIDKDGSVGNTVTKYNSSEDIYGGGTSYGLRICSRFSVVPGSFENQVTITNEGNYAELSKVLSEMSNTITKMNDVVENIHQNHQFIKTTLSNIKNNRVNVPYVKQVNGKDYWFVNGRNTYISISDPNENKNNKE